MTRLTEKRLLLLTIGITVLISGGLGFLIWSDLRTIDEEKARKADLDRQIEAAEKEIAVRPDREYRVIANREISDKEVAFLPEEEEIETFWEVLERFAQDSGVRISEIGSSTTVQRGGRGKKGGDSTISTVPQVLSLRGSIDEFLRFINMIENYERIINVSEYAVTAAESPDEEGKYRHGIRLALTTFTYSKKIASTIVSIPKYEEKRELPEVKKWLSRIKVQEKETYTLPPSLQRRDPFVSVRQRPNTKVSPTEEADPEYQKGLIDNLVELVKGLQNGLGFEEQLQQRGDLWRLTQQRKDNREAFSLCSEQIAIANKDVTIPDLRERLKKDVLVPWAAIQKRMEEMRNANPRLTVAQVQEWVDKVAKLYDEQKWPEVENECRAFRDSCKNGAHVEDDAKDLVQKIFEFQRSAKVIDAFYKRKIKITTILYSPNGVSVAVINDKQMTVGDALDADGQVVVVEIGENYVIFETEGVDIKKAQTEK